jgi:hypothetical protein
MLLPHLKKLSLAKAAVAAIRKPARIKHHFFIVAPPFFRDTRTHPRFGFLEDSGNGEALPFRVSIRDASKKLDLISLLLLLPSPDHQEKAS